MGYILIHVRGPGGPSLSGASARRADGMGATPQGPRGAHLVDVRVRAERVRGARRARPLRQAVGKVRQSTNRGDPTRGERIRLVSSCRTTTREVMFGKRSRRTTPRRDKATRGGAGSLLFHTRSRGVSASGQVRMKERLRPSAR